VFRRLRATTPIFTPERATRQSDQGLAQGIDATTPEQAVAEIRSPLAVWKRGRRTVTRQPPELHVPG